MQIVALTRDDVSVEWENIGEGYCGDYDPDDPEDLNFLRFSVNKFTPENGWEQVDNGSYCTLVEASTDPAVLMEYLQMIMNECYPVIKDGGSIKKICEHLSHLGRTPPVAVCGKNKL